MLANDSSSPMIGSSFQILPIRSFTHAMSLLASSVSDGNESSKDELRSLHHARSLAAMQVFRGREPSKEVLSLAFLLISGTI